MRKTIAKCETKSGPLIGLISSKNPVPALIETVRSLFRGGCTGVIVVDDGSDDETARAIFDRAEEAGAQIIHLEKNVGKAKALQAGFQAMPQGAVIVQTDDDTLAGDLTGPLNRIKSGKADIVDIRVEVMKTRTLIGSIQELAYWIINTAMKRFQDWMRARIWMSGASVMYSYEAGKVLIMEEAFSMTEDTEGLFRARTRGLKIRFHSSYKAKFMTMVPEDMGGVIKQWRRWTTGTGQIIGKYGLGGGNLRVAAVNLFGWGYMLFPVYQGVQGIGSPVETCAWIFGTGAVFGILGAIRLRRARLAGVGVLLPVLQLVWIAMALSGLWFAWRLSRKGSTGQLAWVSPKRTTIVELTDQVPGVAAAK
ncbi:glycosyltransferase family 2 protein [Candidatus Saccharibacteria bacterium]|nr:glycosyltransferase family 2 protein [Candidatus Saccharibacteria bacterium]